MRVSTASGAGFNIVTAQKNTAQTWKFVSKYGAGNGCVRFNEPLILQRTYEQGTTGVGNGYVRNNGGSVTGSKDYAEHFKFFPVALAVTPGKPTLHTVSERLMVRWTVPATSAPVAESYVGVQKVGETDWKYVDTSVGNTVVNTRAQVGAGVHGARTSVIIEGMAKNQHYQAAVTVRVGTVWGKWSLTSDSHHLVTTDHALSFQKTPVHYWVDDGCSSRDGLNDAPDADKYWDALMPVAGVRCCNSNGGGCATPVECPQTLTWDQANKLCTARNQRLCKRDELGACCNTGGGHRRRRCDSYPVWTSTTDVAWRDEQYWEQAWSRRPERDGDYCGRRRYMTFYNTGNSLEACKRKCASISNCYWMVFRATRHGGSRCGTSDGCNHWTRYRNSGNEGAHVGHDTTAYYYNRGEFHGHIHSVPVNLLQNSSASVEESVEESEDVQGTEEEEEF
jgi:hypothetical protein